MADGNRSDSDGLVRCFGTFFLAGDSSGTGHSRKRIYRHAHTAGCPASASAAEQHCSLNSTLTDNRVTFCRCCLIGTREPRGLSGRTGGAFDLIANGYRLRAVSRFAAICNPAGFLPLMASADAFLPVTP